MMLNPRHTAIDSGRGRLGTKDVLFTPEGKNTISDKVCDLSEKALKKLKNILKDHRKSNDQKIKEIEELEENDITENFKHTAYYQKSDGIASRFAIVRKALQNFNQNDGYTESNSEEYLEFSFHSKMLKSDYLRGITKATIREIYDYIISLGLFTIKGGFKTFLGYTFITDIDIKSDFYDMPISNTIDFLKGAEVLTKIKHNAESEGLTGKGSITNLGLWWGSRHNFKTYKSNPYIKFYHKFVELYNQSTEFYEKFISSKHTTEELKQVLRLEGQIKNRDHLNSLLKILKIETTSRKPYESNRLINFLNLESDTLFSMLQIMLGKHIDKKTTKKTGVEVGTLGKKDKMIVECLNGWIFSNGTLESFIDWYNNDIPDRSNKNKNKNHISALFKIYLSSNKTLIKKNDFKSAIDFLIF